MEKRENIVKGIFAIGSAVKNKPVKHRIESGQSILSMNLNSHSTEPATSFVNIKPVMEFLQSCFRKYTAEF